MSTYTYYTYVRVRGTLSRASILARRHLVPNPSGERDEAEKLR